MPWDPTLDFTGMWRNTQDFMSLWRCEKPTIAQVHGAAVAGGSDIALCCDFLIMADDARIGYPPARVWGVPTPAMWVYRLGPQMAKRMMMTGDLIDGKRAVEIGLALDCAPEAELGTCVESQVRRLRGVPRNQLMMTKMVVNQAYEAMGLWGWPIPSASQRFLTTSPVIRRRVFGSESAPRRLVSSRPWPSETAARSLHPAYRSARSDSAYSAIQNSSQYFSYH